MIERYAVDHQVEHYHHHDVMHDLGPVPVQEHVYVGAMPYHEDTSYEELNLGQVSDTAPAPADKPALHKPVIHGAHKEEEPRHAE